MNDNATGQLVGFFEVNTQRVLNIAKQVAAIAAGVKRFICKSPIKVNS